MSREEARYQEIRKATLPFVLYCIMDGFDPRERLIRDDFMAAENGIFYQQSFGKAVLNCRKISSSVEKCFHEGCHGIKRCVDVNCHGKGEPSSVKQC